MDLIESKKRGHELRDTKYKPLLLSAVALIVLAAVSFVAMRGVFNLLEAYEASVERQPSPLAQRELPPKPLLQVDPYVDWNTYKAREKQELSVLRWVNKEQGVVQLPMERAKEIMAQRGLPSRSAPAVEVREGQAVESDHADELPDDAEGRDEIGSKREGAETTRAAGHKKKGKKLVQ